MLIIAEKPELAKAIAAAFTSHPKRISNAYFDCGTAKIIWCFGHMLALKDPEDYDPKYKKWTMSDLPIVMIPWSKKPIADKKTQLNTIISLIKSAKIIVHAGDPDGEGQLLIDEILEYAGPKAIAGKPIKRLLINDNNVAIVKKALANMKDNSEYKGLSNSAEARSVADQLYGYNMSRACTLSANSGAVLTIGRVQTPILGLVVRRDLENEAHEKSFYYDVDAQFKFEVHQFNKGVINAVDIAGNIEIGNIEIIETKARYLVKSSDNVDEKKRLLDHHAVRLITQQILHQKALLKNKKTEKKQQSAPLPYNLLKLQMDCSRKFGLNADVVLSVTQSLREKHKLITYNRSDCEYLNDEHHIDAPDVLAAIANTAHIFSGIIKRANPSLKSRAFNNAKVSAHHAIIPTQTSVDINRLTQNEVNVYQLIARQYIAQFYPIRTYEETKILIECPIKNGHSFEAKSILPINDGWKVLYKNDLDNKDVGKDDVDSFNNLATLQVNNVGENITAKVLEKETKPRPLYTRATLLGDLSRVAKYIKDDKLRLLLQEKDKEKSGEHGGIGTPATRAFIIQGLFDRNFLIDKGKSVISTQLARDFYAALPDMAKYPDMTAIWHEQQIAINQGKLSVLEFIQGINQYIAAEIENIKMHPIKVVTSTLTAKPFKSGGISKNSNKNSNKNLKFDTKNIDTNSVIYSCPSCHSNLRKIKGKEGFFWGCSGYPTCKKTFKNSRDKPVIS